MSAGESIRPNSIQGEAPMAMTSDNQTSQPSITAEGTAQIAAPAEARRPEPNALPSETLVFFHGDELRARVFHDKYALRDPDGGVLEPTPVEMWRRIAGGLASVEPTPEARERYAGEFYWLMEDFRFIPGGRIMHAIGNNKRVTALNCYVLPIKEDSIEAIFDWTKEAART